MFAGTIIDELMDLVGKTEQQARIVTQKPPVSAEKYRAFTYIYDFASRQQMRVGVA